MPPTPASARSCRRRRPTTRRSVIATTTVPSAGAKLTVLDPSTNAPGHLVNGDYVLPQPLQVKAGDGGFAPISATPLTLLTFTQATTDQPNTIVFKQSVGANDPLRAGRYVKTLTFTLATTQP